MFPQHVELVRETSTGAIDIARFTVQFGGSVRMVSSSGENLSLGLTAALEHIHALIGAGYRMRG